MKTATRVGCLIFSGLITALLAALLLTSTARAQAREREGLPDNLYADQTSLPTQSEFRDRYRVGWAVGGSTDGYAVILHTDDSGVTWTRQGQAGKIPDFSAMGVSAVDALNARVVGDNVTLHTQDGGLTWKQEKLPDDLPQGFTLSQVKALDRHTAFAVGSQGVLLQTRMGPCPKRGSKWVRMRTASNMPLIHFSDVDALDTNHVWAVGGMSCPPYKTVDGGRTWSPTSKVLCGGCDANRVVAVTRRLIWVAADHGIFQTTDGGANWEDTGGCSGFCYALSATGIGHAWASSLFGPLGKLYRWVAIGKQWESQPVPAASSMITISFVDARR